MKKILIYLLTLTFVLGISAPAEVSAQESLQLYSRAAVVIDGEDGRILYGKAADEEYPMASTTKIMTLILALEYGTLDNMIQVSSYAAKMPEVRLGLKNGETYRLEDLLYSMMLESHNDSAVAIAEHVGGSLDCFIELMNKKAAELGLHNTYFLTPNGLDATKDGIEHHTTAYELALLMRYCILCSPKKEDFIRICQTRTYSFSEAGGKRSFTVNNKNAFLDMYENVIAGKTGFTGNAGYCYVCAVERDNKAYIVALLGCGWPPDRTYKWKDTKKLYAYVFDNFSYKKIFDKSYKLPDIHVSDGIEAEFLDVSVNEELSAMISADDSISVTENIPTELAAPIKKGEQIGSLIIKINGDLYKIINVYSDEAINKKDYGYYFRKVLEFFYLL